MFQPLGMPRKFEWLASHHEAGQTFADFMSVDRRYSRVPKEYPTHGVPGVPRSTHGVPGVPLVRSVRMVDSAYPIRGLLM